jgi:hypothetical protein
MMMIVPFEEVRTWPLFKVFRQQELYKDLLKKYAPNQENSESTTEIIKKEEEEAIDKE